MAYSDWIRENQDIVDQALAAYDASKAPPSISDEQLLNPQSAQPAPQSGADQPQVPQVSMPSGPPRRALQEIYSQQADATNQQMESVMREGMAESQAARAQSALIGRGASEVRGIVDESRERHKATQERVDKYTKQRDEVIAKLSEPLPQLSRGRKAGTIIAGIIGVMGSMTGVNGLAYGMQAVQDMISADLREKLKDRERNKELLGVLNDTLKSLGVEDLNEQNQARVLAANQLLVTEQEVLKVAKDLEGTKAGEDAIQLAQEMRQKALANFAAIQQQEQARRDAAAKEAAAKRAQQAATAEEAQLYAALAQAKTDEERQQIAGLYGAKGAKALKDLLENEKLAAENAKAAGTGAAPQGREIADPKLWASASDKEKEDFRGAQAAFNGFENNARKLMALLEKHGNESAGPVMAEMESLLASLTGQYNKMMKFGALDAGTQEVIKQALGDPTAFFGSGANSLIRLRTALEAARESIESQATSIGLHSNRPQDILQRMEAPAEDRMRPTPGGAPAVASQGRVASAPGMVTVRNPQTGDTRQIRRDMLSGAEQRGYFLVEEPAPAPAPAPAPRAQPNSAAAARVERNRRLDEAISNLFRSEPEKSPEEKARINAEYMAKWNNFYGR